VIMLVPVLSTVTPGAARARRGRQAAIAGVTRAGADLALILLAVVAGWQLRHYSAVSAGAGGTFGVDPVIVAAPALALAGGTVLALRLLPAGGKAGDRLAARGRRLTAAMASWQISRQPIRQGGAALLRGEPETDLRVVEIEPPPTPHPRSLSRKGRGGLSAEGLLLMFSAASASTPRAKYSQSRGERRAILIASSISPPARAVS